MVAEALAGLVLWVLVIARSLVLWLISAHIVRRAGVLCAFWWLFGGITGVLGVGLLDVVVSEPSEAPGVDFVVGGLIVDGVLGELWGRGVGGGAVVHLEGLVLGRDLARPVAGWVVVFYFAGMATTQTGLHLRHLTIEIRSLRSTFSVYIPHP